MRLSTSPSHARLVANQANAQHSTGPKTEEGKAAVSQNNWRHGLCGHFAVLAWEKEEDYLELIEDLRDEHQPSTPTELLLVDRLAQHHWLLQRALTLQGTAFDDKYPLCDSTRLLALYLRYQTTHERAFHKCLAELAKLRAERRKANEESKDEAALSQRAEDSRKVGFESQKHPQAVEPPPQELHEVAVPAANICHAIEFTPRKASAPPITARNSTEATPAPEEIASKPALEIQKAA